MAGKTMLQLVPVLHQVPATTRGMKPALWFGCNHAAASKSALVPALGKVLVRYLS